MKNTRNEEKTLSIIVPIYNTEKYLARCLDSVVFHDDLNKDLEIIAVNDGSTDSSLAIAQEYQKRYPETIKIIDKENGGHGSAINAGVKAASAKYLRILDSDDYFNIDDFHKYVEFLKSADEDIVVTNLKHDVLYDCSERSYEFNKGEEVEHYKIDEIGQFLETENFFRIFSMGSMTIKVQTLLDNWDEGLPEKTFYVDQIFVARLLAVAKDFCITPFDIYRYFIGRPEQSVNSDSFFKHRDNHETVLRKLMQILDELKEQKRDVIVSVLEKQIVMMLRTHYNAYIYGDTNKHIMQEVRNLDAFIAEHEPEIYQQIDDLSRDIASNGLSLRRK